MSKIPKGQYFVHLQVGSSAGDDEVIDLESSVDAPKVMIHDSDSVMLPEGSQGQSEVSTGQYGGDAEYSGNKICNHCDSLVPHKNPVKCKIHQQVAMGSASEKALIKELFELQKVREFQMRLL